MPQDALPFTTKPLPPLEVVEAEVGKVAKEEINPPMIHTNLLLLKATQTASTLKREAADVAPQEGDQKAVWEKLLAAASRQLP